MKIKLGTLRRLLREADAWPGQPAGRNVMSPDVNSRESLDTISAKAMDTVADQDGLPDHLLEPTVDPKDCMGPVPPTAEKPYVQLDPFVKASGPNTTGTLRR